jgi:hypothetical protein
MVNGRRRVADALLSSKRRARVKARATERQSDQHHFVFNFLLTFILNGSIFFSLVNISSRADRQTERSIYLRLCLSRNVHLGRRQVSNT